VRYWIVPLVLAAACGSKSPQGVAVDGGDDAPAIDGPGTVVDAGPCGGRTDRRGLTHREAQIGDAARTYLVYLPMDVDPHAPMPLVVVFHGYTMSGQDMYDVTQYAALADSEHVAVAFPDGQGGAGSLGAPWNVGDNVCPSYAGAPPDATGDDFAFLDAMKADIASDQCLDTAHEFVTGFSMGGYFSHHVACERSDIRAVAPHSGGTHPLDQCPGTIKPIIIFHGDADEVIPTGCDDPGATAVAGVTPSATAWAVRNGCAATTTTTTVDNGTCRYYDACPANAQVAVCTFSGMGHCWAGGPQSLYGCPNYEKATQYEWAFWKQYAW
jgi:polyhydroxybutyrate depolymerase